MAKEDEKKPTAAEKGKAKAVNGDAQKDKDAKPEAEDKKTGVTTTGGTYRMRDSCHGECTLIASRRGAQRRGPTTEE